MAHDPLRRSLMVGLPIGLVAAACGAIPPSDLQSPTLGFNDFTLTDLGLEQIRFLLTVDAANPNDIDVPLSNLTFTLDLFDRPVAQGRARERSFVLPKNGSRTVPIEFQVPTDKLLDAMRRANFTDLGTIGYRLKGSARYGSGPFSIPFERKGSLKALQKLMEPPGERT